MRDVSQSVGRCRDMLGRLRILALVIVASAGVLAGLVNSPTANAEATVLREQFISLFLPVCTGEYVLLEVTVQSVISESGDAAGGMHGRQVTITNAGGVGQSSGKKYRLVFAQVLGFNFVDETRVQTGVFRLRLVREGAPLLYSDLSVHVTETNGEFKVFRIDQEAGCRGPAG
jgi:hypothetical protein